MSNTLQLKIQSAMFLYKKKPDEEKEENVFNSLKRKIHSLSSKLYIYKDYFCKKIVFLRCLKTSVFWNC